MRLPSLCCATLDCEPTACKTTESEGSASKNSLCLRRSPLGDGGIAERLRGADSRDYAEVRADTRIGRRRITIQWRVKLSRRDFRNGWSRGGGTGFRTRTSAWRCNWDSTLANWARLG